MLTASPRPSRKARSGRILDESGTPYRIRTGVTAVRGRRHKPLDEGSFGSLSICPGFAGAAIIRTQFLFPSGVN